MLLVCSQSRCALRAKLVRVSVALSVLVVALVWAVWLLAGREDMWKALGQVPLASVVGLAAVALGVTACNGLVWRELVGHFGVRLRAAEWFGLAMITSMANYMMPFRGGAAVRAAYLKQRRGFSLGHFGSTFASGLAFQVLTRLVVALGCLVVLAVLGRRSSGVLIGVCGAGTLAVVATMVFTPRFRRPDNRVMAAIWQVGDGWRRLHRNAALVARVFALSVAATLGTALMYFVALRALGTDVGILLAATVSVFSEMVGLLSVTPAGLGVHEAAAALSADLLGAQAAMALVAVLLLRGAMIFVSFTLGPLFLALLHWRPTAEARRRSADEGSP